MWRVQAARVRRTHVASFFHRHDWYGVPRSVHREQRIHSNGLAAGHFALPLVQLLFLFALFDHLHHHCSLDSDEGDAAEYEESHGEAGEEDTQVAPANLKSHVLVRAQEAAPIERNHEVAQNDQRAVKHHLHAVQLAALIRRVERHRVDEEGRGEEHDAELQDPVVVQDDHEKGEDELARELQGGVLVRDSPLCLLFIADEAQVERAPLLAENLALDQTLVVPVVEEDDGEREGAEEEEMDPAEGRLERFHPVVEGCLRDGHQIADRIDNERLHVVPHVEVVAKHRSKLGEGNRAALFLRQALDQTEDHKQEQDRDNDDAVEQIKPRG